MSERNFVNPATGKSAGEGGVRFIRPKELHDTGIEGVLFEGSFLEAVANKYNSDKFDYKFETESGETVVVNGAGNLGYRMKEIIPGDFCQVIYEGKKPIASGKYKGTLSHSFMVFKDSDE